jgi:hypothetical protein
MSKDKSLEENITPANIGGMGAVVLPTQTQDGSGDIPAGHGDAEEEYKKKNKKNKMKKLESFESFVKGMSNDNSVDEARFAANSGTMSGGIYVLDHDVYELKKDVKGVEIGNYINIVLPKGTIINNLPGGVFALHDSLRQYEDGMRKYTSSIGIPIKRKDDTINLISKNSKVLESVVTEGAVKGKGLIQFAKDEKDEGNNSEIYLATFDGSSMEAQSTTKTWDDGVPVTKYFTRGGYKTISPKGEIYILETDNWWYFWDRGTWYAVKRKDYGSPPFEY